MKLLFSCLMACVFLSLSLFSFLPANDKGTRDRKLKHDVIEAVNELIQDLSTCYEQISEQAVEHIHQKFVSPETILRSVSVFCCFKVLVLKRFNTCQLLPKCNILFLIGKCWWLIMECMLIFLSRQCIKIMCIFYKMLFTTLNILVKFYLESNSDMDCCFLFIGNMGYFILSIHISQIRRCFVLHRVA